MARIVTHGTKAMLALPGGTFDLRGLAAGALVPSHPPAVGGLSRNWLPWVTVANVEGIMRLEEFLGKETAGPRSPVWRVR